MNDKKQGISPKIKVQFTLTENEDCELSKDLNELMKHKSNIGKAPKKPH